VELETRVEKSVEVVRDVVRYSVAERAGTRGCVRLGATRVQRCPTFRVRNKRTDHITKMHREHVPGAFWQWSSLVVGTALTATGLGLMGKYGKYAGGGDTESINRGRRVFLGGLWLFLPGITLTALAIAWLVLGDRRTVVEKGKVRGERFRLDTYRCASEPLSDTALAARLPQREKTFGLGRTDRKGQLSVDLAAMMAAARVAKVPAFIDVVRGAAVDEVVLPEAVIDTLRSLFVQKRLTLDPTRRQTEKRQRTATGGRQIRIKLGGSENPRVARLVLRCAKHLRVILKLDPPVHRGARDATGKSRRGADESDAAADESAVPVPAAGNNLWLGEALVKKGNARALAKGQRVVLLCAPKKHVQLHILAKRAKAHTWTLDIQAKAHTPTGRVRARKGRFFLLDKGRNDLVVTGRRGVLYGPGRKTPFEVVRATADRAAVKLVEAPGRKDGAVRSGKRRRYRTYRLDP
jgi:hypothetical protein